MKLTDVISIVILFHLKDASGIRNATVAINPRRVQRGQRVTLQCDYDLEGSSLYLLKWYRGNYEFCRYVPNENPTLLTFPYPGIEVDVSQTSGKRVVLRDVGFNLSGNITCEITTDAPPFSTAVATTNVTVVDLPKNGPVINIQKERYFPGDRFNANCSTSPSKPASHLVFKINKIKVSRDENVEIHPGPETLYWSSLSVSTILLPSHFDNVHHTLTVSCTASISNYYVNATVTTIPRKKDPKPERVSSSCRSQTTSILALFAIIGISVMETK